MAKPIKHPCADCGRPVWRHKDGNQLSNTCERFKRKPKVIGRVTEVVVNPDGTTSVFVEPLKTGDERVETPTSPEPITGGE